MTRVTPTNGSTARHSQDFSTGSKTDSVDGATGNATAGFAGPDAFTAPPASGPGTSAEGFLQPTTTKHNPTSPSARMAPLVARPPPEGRGTQMGAGERARVPQPAHRCLGHLPGGVGRVAAFSCEAGQRVSVFAARVMASPTRGLKR